MMSFFADEFHFVHVHECVWNSPASLLLIVVLQAQKDRIFIKGGIVVNDDEMVEADVFIESGLIK